MKTYVPCESVMLCECTSRFLGPEERMAAVFPNCRRNVHVLLPLATFYFVAAAACVSLSDTQGGAALSAWNRCVHTLRSDGASEAPTPIAVMALGLFQSKGK